MKKYWIILKPESSEVNFKKEPVVGSILSSLLSTDKICRTADFITGPDKDNNGRL